MKNINKMIKFAFGAVLPLLAVSALVTTSAMAQTGLILFSGSGTLSSEKGAPTVSGLFTVEPNGANLTHLCTNDAATIAWSPGQTYVAFAVGLPGTIYVMQAAGTLNGGSQFVAARGGVSPSWSPTGTQIVYQTEPLPTQLYTVSVDPAAGTAGTPEPLIDDPANNYWEPNWSPDGTRIAFERTTSPSSSTTAIFIYTVGTGEVEELPTPYAGVMMMPQWSPNSSEITFYASPSSSKDKAGFYLVNANGTGLEPFPDLPAGAADLGDSDILCWSEDGSAIALVLEEAVSRTTTVSSLVVQERSTGVATVLTPPTLSVGNIAWLP